MKKIKREVMTVVKKVGMFRFFTLVMCAVMLVAAIPFAARAVSGTLAAPDKAAEKPEGYVVIPDAPPPAVLEDKPVTYGKQATTPLGVWWQNLPFWRWFNFLMYKYDPVESVVYNEQNAFQRVFGYNELYDHFMWVCNVYADTLRIKFPYEGKDWLIQLWKGSYAVFLCAGSEIGVYNKPQGKQTIQYSCAKPEDYLRMDMRYYVNGDLLFSRPYDYYWWCTGFYVFRYLPGWLVRPRLNCMLEATIELKSPEMARLFAEQLNKEGFQQTTYVNGPDTPDSYTLKGSKLSLVWHSVNQSFY
ncbi:MAG: DUF4474 domain-containing protein [Oscillospiraceae bacterium]|nr:DUF4474 domain-containing protein [Oscillospiraceae bacterium]